MRGVNIEEKEIIGTSIAFCDSDSGQLIQIQITFRARESERAPTKRQKKKSHFPQQIQEKAPFASPEASPFGTGCTLRLAGLNQLGMFLPFKPDKCLRHLMMLLTS
jgi:hypothetical protein